MDFYLGRSPSAGTQIADVVREDYKLLRETYGDAIVSAAVLAFSRLDGEERERHVQEVLEAIPRRTPGEVDKSFTMMMIRRMRDGQIREEEQLDVLRVLLTPPEDAGSSPASKKKRP